MTIKVYQFPPAFGLPNASPFCMKLETYLRMAGLPYQLKNGMHHMKAPKGKLPYIEDDGRVIGDSGLIIEYLRATRGDPLDAGLSVRDRSRALAIRRLVEENLYWAMLYSRWIDEPGWSMTRAAFFDPLPAPLRWVAPRLAQRSLRRSLHGHGMGRHSRDEIYAIGCADIEALSRLLGEQAFFLGEKPTSIDATTYAFLANIVQVELDTPLRRRASSQSNLARYCERMKARYYPEATP